ncbi:MAG: hypothetical protein AB7T06_20255 [Kofleriaceae bacterium]
MLQLALGALIGIAISSCWVDRRTSDFTCKTDNDCLSFSPSRVCDTDLGYCVPGTNPTDCPPQCNAGCNKNQMTCAIACGNGASCDGELVCPSGWDCTIDCGTGACDAVTCQPGADCTINCNGGGACGDIECGDGRCDIVCMGGGACGTIDCNDSSCDVTCNGGGACPRVECDNACRCDVECQTGSSCNDINCLDVACELTPNGCDAERTGCPTTCPAGN